MLVLGPQKMNYGRFVNKEKNTITFPINFNPYMEGWRSFLQQSISEEQLLGSGAISRWRSTCKNCGNTCDTALPKNNYALMAPKPITDNIH